jgi:hypothetical protein
MATVMAISKSLPDKATSTVYIPGNTNAPDFTINAGEGIQIYLKDKVDFSLSSSSEAATNQ